MADYALPVAVISFSFIGSFVFDKVSLQQFDATEVRLEIGFVFYLFFFLLGGLTYSQVIPLVSLEIVLRTRQLDLHPVLNTKTFPLIEGTFSTFQQPVLVQCSN